MSRRERAMVPWVPLDVALVRAGELLLRAGLRAILVTFVLLALALALLCLGLAIQAVAGGAWPIALVGVIVAFAGAFAAPVALHAGVLATFAASERGPRSALDALQSALWLAPALLGNVFLSTVSCGLLLGFAAFTAAGVVDAREPGGERVVYGAIALGTSLLGAWIHGSFLVGEASLALGRGPTWAMAGPDTRSALLLGALPIAAAGAFGGAIVLHERGASLGVMLPEPVLAVAGVVATALAHIASGAVAVAIARGPEAEP